MVSVLIDCKTASPCVIKQNPINNINISCLVHITKADALGPFFGFTSYVTPPDEFKVLQTKYLMNVFRI